MRVSWTEAAWEDYLDWPATDKKILKRINTLITAVQREPLSGPGKPEPLKHHLAGYWSRRIDRAHRLIYKAASNEIVIVQCRYHY